MSNSSGNNATPETPVFTGPQGYASKTLEVQGSPSYTSSKETPEANYSVTRKGYAPGTFVIGGLKNQSEKERPVIQGVPRPRVGNEARNKEFEKMMRLGKLAKEAGIEIDTDPEGNMQVTLPEELVSSPEEEELRRKEHARREQVEKELTKKAKLLEDILELTSEVDMEMEEAKALEDQLSDAARRADFRNVIERMKILFASVRNTKDAAIKKQFEDVFSDYRRVYKKEIEEFIRKNPKSVSVPVVSFPAPSSPSPVVPAAAQAPATPPVTARSFVPITPEQREKMRIDQGWPEDKVFYKEGDGDTAGWYVNDKGSDHFSKNQERWGTEYKHFSDSFEEYKKIVAEISADDAQKIKPLVESKNRLIETIRKWNVNAVTAERKRFEAALSKWKKYFLLQQTLESFEKAVKTGEKAKEAFEHEHESKHLDDEKAKVEHLYSILKQAAISGIPVKDDDIAKLKSLIETYATLVQTLETKNKSLGRGVLRPIKITEANKNKKIKVIGKPEMTLAEYDKEQKQGKEEVEITGDMLGRWHELGTNYRLGDRITKKDFDDLTVFIAYDRMFRKNEKDFLSLYATPEYDKERNDIRYVSNRRFQMGTDQEKTAIRKVFKRYGLVFADQTHEERKASFEKEGLEKKVTAPSYKETFRPAFKHTPNLKEGKPEMKEEHNVMKRVDDIGHIERMADPTVFAAVEKYESLKNERRRLTIAHPSFEGDEANLDQVIEELKNDRDNKDLHREYLEMFTRYENEVTPFIEGRKKEISLGLILEGRGRTLEANKKKEEVLKKIDAILEKRTGQATKKAELAWGDAVHAGNGKIRRMVILASVLGAVGTYYALNGSAPAAEQPPQKTEQTVEQEKPWREYVASYAKDLQKDLDTNMSIRELVAKHVPKLVHDDKPASIDNILGMDGHKVLNVENVYNMSDEQQMEISNFLRSLQNIYEATHAPARAKAVALRVPYNPPNDVEIGPQGTVRDYLQKIMKKVSEAGK